MNDDLKTYEYLFLLIGSGIEKDRLKNLFKKLGERGWEYSGTGPRYDITNTPFVFKRVCDTRWEILDRVDPIKDIEFKI
jgi:hypothetical protein